MLIIITVSNDVTICRYSRNFKLNLKWAMTINIEYKFCLAYLLPLKMFCKYYIKTKIILTITKKKIKIKKRTILKCSRKNDSEWKRSDESVYINYKNNSCSKEPKCLYYRCTDFIKLFQNYKMSMKF